MHIGHIIIAFMLLFLIVIAFLLAYQIKLIIRDERAYKEEMRRYLES